MPPASVLWRKTHIYVCITVLCYISRTNKGRFLSVKNSKYLSNITTFPKLLSPVSLFQKQVSIPPFILRAIPCGVNAMTVKLTLLVDLNLEARFQLILISSEDAFSDMSDPNGKNVFIFTKTPVKLVITI